jgi:hypothetical protein
MASPEELFRHSFHDGLEALERNRLENEVELKTRRDDTPEQLSRRILLEMYDDTSRKVLESFKSEIADAEAVLRGGLKALQRVEEFRFLLDNLLEAVKRDDSLNNALLRYRELELLEHPDLHDAKEETTKQSPWPWNRGAGQFLRRLWQRLRKLALTVMEVLVNAIKVVPKFASLKITPIIGITGPFPTLHLEFGLEAESVTIHDLFHDLFDSVLPLAGR